MSAPPTIRRDPPPRVDFGRPTAVLRRRRPLLSLRLDVRTTIALAALAAVALAVGVVSLASGDYPLSVGQVLNALFGTPTRFEQMVVVQWRLPRVLLALLLGAALGASGAIFQSLTRNPLGSPDIIGFNAGAYTGALTAILAVGGGYYGTAAGAMVGGLATAIAVYALAYKRGVQGFRLVIVGIAVSAMLGAFNTWLILRADLETAMVAAVWGAGSLNGVGWGQFGPVAVVLACLLPILALVARPMRILEMGDDAASALGVRAEPLRRVLLVAGVALTALATAAAGPIAFIALAAPQLARRLTRSSTTAMLPAAAMGAALLSASDWTAQHAFGSVSLPVGVVTVSIGGMYLIWLLAREARRA